MKDVDIAYLAGLFDGEGCIHIDKWKNSLKNGHRYALLVQIKMCDGRLLRDLRDKFGGNLRVEKRSLSNPKHSDILIWRFGNVKAKDFLVSISPYLKLKLRQATLGISFQEVVSSHPKGNVAVTTDEILFRENCYNQMKELKKLERGYHLV